MYCSIYKYFIVVQCIVYSICNSQGKHLRLRCTPFCCMVSIAINMARHVCCVQAILHHDCHSSIRADSIQEKLIEIREVLVNLNKGCGKVAMTPWLNHCLNILKSTFFDFKFILLNTDFLHPEHI